MKQPEQWKPMKELDEVYHISNHGRVKSFAVDKIDGRILAPKTTHSGYKQHVIRFKGGWFTFYVHRKVAEYFVPNPNNLPYVDHIKNNKTLNSAWELQWIEHDDNCRKDQSKPIICVSPLGEKIEAGGTRHAMQIASCYRGTVQRCLRNGNVSRHGWKFKYKK